MRKLVVIMVCCMSFTHGYCQSKLTNNFKKIEDVKELKTRADIDSIVRITLHTSSKAKTYKVVTSPANKGIYDLSEKGQKALIEAVNSKTNSESDLIKSIGKNIVITKSSKPFHIENTKFIKKVEIDVRDMLKGTKRVGRIDELYIKIALEENPNVEFIGFNNIATKYEVLDFGKIGLTRNQNFTLNAGFEFAGTGTTTSTATGATSKKAVIDGDTVDISNTLSDSDLLGNSNKSNIGASYSAGRTISEERNLSKRRLVLKGTISKNEAMIYQEGAPGLNLNDKITVELIFKTINNKSDFILNFSGMFNSDGTIRKGSDTTKYKISYEYLTTPIAKSDSISVEYEFTYREVTNKKGKKSLGEWDDKIVYLKATNRDSTRIKSEFIGTSELKENIWTLKDAYGNYLYADYYGKFYQLKFTELKFATDFLLWLIQSEYTSFNGVQILTGKTPKNLKPLKIEDRLNYFAKKM